MKVKKRVLSLLLAFCVVFAFAGCKKSSTGAGSGAVQEDSTVTVGIAGPVLSMDPANYRDKPTETVLRNIFDGLVTTDKDGNVVPMIAESWKQNSDTEYVFTLRKDVKFQDGTPLTAADVKFTFDRIITPNAINGSTSPRQGLISALKSVEIVDDYTVKFILSQPWPIFLKMLPFQQIIPKAYYEKVGEAGFVAHPIGAGPFKVVEASPNDKIVLERFDGYYNGKSSIKNLIFKVLPDNSSRIAALMAGEIQRAQTIPSSMLSTLQNNSDINVKSVNGTTVYMLQMNTKTKEFSNVKVRQAMNYAVDMQTIIDTILNGQATRLAGPMLSNAYAVDTDLKPYSYDPAKAKELLAEAGYPNGFSLVIDCAASEQEVAEAVATQLKKAGINASTRVWDVGVLQPMVLKGERQIYLTHWGNSTKDPYDFLNPCLMTGGRGNYSLYSNSQVDSLLNQGAMEKDDAKRKAIYKQAQDIIYNDCPWIFGYQPKTFEAATKKLVNWEPRYDEMLYMWRVGLEQ